MSKDNELVVNFSEMEDDELFEFKKYIEEKYDQVCADNVVEYTKLIADENFDQYSFLGKRKVNKMIDRHQNEEDGFLFLMEELLKEIKQRRLVDDDYDLIIDTADLTDEEFIERQMKISDDYKNKKD